MKTQVGSLKFRKTKRRSTSGSSTTDQEEVLQSVHRTIQCAESPAGDKPMQINRVPELKEGAQRAPFIL